MGNPLTDGAWTYTWEHGRQLATLTQATDFGITKQPEDFIGQVGDAVQFTVTALGSGLTYQWQVSTDGGKSWSDSGADGCATAEISGFEITEARAGRLYRCKITDVNGSVVYSQPGEIIAAPIVIDTQPEDFYGEIGDTVRFSVEARGTDLTYQWQSSVDGGVNFYNSSANGNTTASISVTLAEHNPGYMYRCKITDADDNVVYSAAATICLDGLAVVTQPEDFIGRVGDVAKFSIEARGTDLTYQWQVSTDGGGYWGNSTAGGYKTANASLWLTENNPGYLYRCKVTDGEGNVVYSEPGEIILLTETWEYTYNADGLRTGRTNGSTTYSYVYNGSLLTQVTVDGGTSTSETLRIGYAGSTPMIAKYGELTFHYVTNLQGDVTAILDGNGTAVVEYTYDAWGNILTITGSMADTLGELNPLRYRAYVYDSETELYYLQSRYYDPEMGRFINADVYTSTGQGILGNNMLAYCRNNPVCRIDITGTADQDCMDTDPLDEEDILGSGEGSGGGGGPSSWSIFLQCLDDATSGLSMPTNRKVYSGTERHHIISDKSNKYTPQYKEITDRYNYSLSQQENIIDLENHKGRHTTAYHDFVMTSLNALDVYAGGDSDKFLQGIAAIATHIENNSWLPYARKGAK